MNELFVITGASRGFGRALSLALLNKYPSAEFLLLASRPSEYLESLKDTFIARKGKVSVDTLNFSDSPEQVHSRSIEILNAFIGEINEKSNIKITLINNAGSLGALKPFSELNPQEISDALNVNLVSGFACFTLAFLQVMKNDNHDWKVQLVNISSLAAIEPFEHWSLYCTGKAARDMLFRCIAKERPDIKVLNYAPGPLDTDMQKEIRDTMPESELKQVFIDMHRQQKLVKADVSAGKLVQLLHDGTFESGSHLDFYDL